MPYYDEKGEYVGGMKPMGSNSQAKFGRNPKQSSAGRKTSAPFPPNQDTYAQHRPASTKGVSKPPTSGGY